MASPDSEVEPPTQTAAAALLLDIFGDSDSDLSDEDDDKKQAARTKPAAASIASSSSGSDQEDDEDSSASDNDKDYGNAQKAKAGQKSYRPTGAEADSDDDAEPSVDADGNPTAIPKSTSFIPNDQQKAPRKKAANRKEKSTTAEGKEKKKRKSKKTSVASGDEGESGGEFGAEREKKVRRKKVERRVSADDRLGGEAQQEEELDEATIRRRMIDAKIEAIGKSSKRKRVRKKEDSEDLGADEIITAVQAEMQRAVEKDIDQNDARRPATYKTQLLPKVLKTLQNVTYQQAIMDTSDFLGALRQFLEPLPDGSLPSLSIQRALLEQLNKMEFSEEMLRESKLGRIVNFYARCKRALPEINRQANHLIDKWSRPMLNHHDARPTQQLGGGSGGMNGGNGNGGASGSGESDLDADDAESRVRQKKKQRTYLAQVVRERQLQDEEEKAESKTTRIPNIFGHAYSVAPSASRPSKSQDELASEEARQRQQERINNFKKKALKAGAR